MYQALYRKYRPLSFDDVVGQEHVVETIKTQISNNKISHAYMFTGTRGTGKTSCAKILARAVNCENPINGNPCNECKTCKGILNGSLLDVYEIDAASNNGVDNIRELREDVMFTPAMAKYKVYIIDEVHMLTTSAFNALLKTLEEPPEHIIFVFATTEITKVLPTILSRCQRFDFKRITADDIAKRLLYVANKEQISLDPDAAALISRLADGAMRDALSILDRCITIGQNVTLETVEKTVGLCPYEQISQLLLQIANNDTDSVLQFYSECKSNSKDAVSLFSELCSYYRDLIVIKLSATPDKFLNYDSEKIENLKEVSKAYTIESIIRCVNILQNGIYDVTKFKDKHIMAEMTLIKLTNDKIGNDFDDLNSRLSKLEILGCQPSSQPVKQAAKPQPKPSAPAKVLVPSGDDTGLWKKTIEIVDALGGKSVSAIMKTLSASFKDQTLLIHCSKEHFAYTALSMPDNMALIKKALQQATGELYSIKFLSSSSNVESDDLLDEFLTNANDILYKE